MAEKITTTLTGSGVPAGTDVAVFRGTFEGEVNAIVAPAGLTLVTGVEDARGFAPVSNSNPVPISDAGGSITVDGTVSTTLARPGTASIARVATSTGSATLKAANANRLRGLLIDNDSDSTLYVKFGTSAASNTDYSVRIDPRTSWQDPTDYTGEVRAILAAGTGNAQVTELTA